MKLTLHHINLSTTNVEAMDDFYQDVLGLDRETEGLPVLEKTQGYSGDVAFVSDGGDPGAPSNAGYRGRVPHRADRQSGLARAYCLSL